MQIEAFCNTIEIDLDLERKADYTMRVMTTKNYTCGADKALF